jgi:uncharacterized protein (DUF362 family)
MKRGNPKPKEKSLTRREFLSSSAFLPIVIMSGSGCRKRVEIPRGLSEVMRKVKRYHQEHGQLPENPVAIAFEPSIGFYPSIRKLDSFTSEFSDVYWLVARALMLLNPDNIENPLGGLIKPGDTVVIKPNWSTQYEFPFPITHPSIVYPLVEFALKAGAAKVNIVEAPMTLTRACGWYWSSAMTGAFALAEQLSKQHGGAEVNFIDGNDDDFVWVDVGEASELRDYDFAALDHDGHTGFGKDMFFDVEDHKGYKPHQYRRGLAAVARSYLESDVFINVPKLKVHGYTGITIALKNLMGLNVRSTLHKMPIDVIRAYEARSDFKECLESPMRDIPHFDRVKIGDFSEQTQKKRYHTGFGNDVLWRSLADLNKIIIYADSDGVMHKTPQRRCLSVVDGIVGIEKEGPVSGHIVHSKCVVAGRDPVCVDAVCAHLIGWNPQMLNLITNTAACTRLAIGNFENYIDSIVGETLNSPCFNQRYIPPITFRDDVISPYTILRT